MNLAEYREQVGKIPYGKRLPTALYVHREGLAGVGGSLRTVLDLVVARYQVTMEFNLVKFRTDELKLSFLAYPGFDSDPHPALKHAVTIDLATGKARHTDYAVSPERRVASRISAVAADWTCSTSVGHPSPIRIEE